MDTLRKLLVTTAAIAYTLLYGFPFGRFIFDFLARLERHGPGAVSSSDLRALQALITIALHIGLTVTVVFTHEKVRGAFAFAYLASLATSFFMPLIFTDMRFRGFISFSWQFDGAVWMVINVIFGPAMVLAVIYSGVRVAMRLHERNTH